MGKLKNMALETYFNSMTSPVIIYTDEDLRGLAAMVSQLQKLYGQDSDGATVGNNSSCPSTTETTTSSASKPKTLTLNAQAKQNTTTLETNQTA